MLRLAITGAGGFLGWHVRVLLRALGWPEPVRITAHDLTDPATVADRVTGVDRVLHLAGVNRGDPADVAAGNVQLAAAVARGLRRSPNPPAGIVFANSVQAGNGTPYGDSKASAAATLADVGLGLVDLRLPNLYGEHGRPHYNSVVGTFCRLLADDGAPDIHEDRDLSLVHVTDAAAALVGAPATGVWDSGMPALHTKVGELADRLAGYAATYRRGEIPALDDRHAVRLFNTYRSHCFPQRSLIPLPRRADHRGELVESVKAHAGPGQTFCSTTHPGVVRGEHFHLAKVERFVVLRGRAEISLRRIGEQGVTRFAVDGADPVAVDMPTMWAHRIVNTGPEELLTMFWTNEIFDPERPDTYPEPVEVGPSRVAVGA
ncbi:UDP-2-acetamido-2,6-beta-L-arabino-hexul-4-ose reductase [Micromonospora phaseoli]|uniref:UDP-2-acetamido-2,6-beta-L-arabino-hexul-4-ose reductase n=1 Tax=Micromonospora phaseoli TaxID=1144548 RepID=A0A1H6SDH4_9ACTN|nr:NAD-dependent epimerase/dehydratase family protein [Micromonospora phaseoli]PZW03917.1 UDP-2-acetamido-2,6-beta-L-arabino-hexul-4-ose reductase [Micromonospora phaseoli]GIJ77669.1 capsular polysaccharide biosynthesis protein CapF [Micromonospora phaseoli]SEI66053.1 UDP-2-acetamido-2,6-beta-L-arabino-hexul-4-ose reductase [Micromonospora phaseoli]